MTLLLGNKKEERKKQEPVPQQKTAAQEKTEKIEKHPTMSATKEQISVTKKVEKQEQAPKKAVEAAVKVEKQTAAKEKVQTPITQKKTARVVLQSRIPQSSDEILKEKFLKRLRSLGGDYFEYYSVYLLERYSMKNGRRLESLRICGGERDGGIDGEIELTDKLGFRETIYIQAKNWNPDKGDEKYWVVGETLLQQFLGACVCRQAKDGKQHCRGIFMTTSRFTPEGKRLLEQMSDRLVGYDANDLYEAAKECSFGLVQKNGEWTLDEKLLSGERAFFALY
jgi:restriction endonuclease Mrr